MSIYETIGGADSVSIAVEKFYDRVLADSLLARYFASTDMAQQQRHMRAFLAVAIGGPEIYGGRDMRAAHAGMNITDEAFDRVVEHLVATLEALDVPTDVIGEIGEKLLPLRADVVQAAPV